VTLAEIDVLEPRDVFGELPAPVVLIDEIARIRRLDLAAAEFIVRPLPLRFTTMILSRR
jgi:hypothetical protein